MNVPFFNWQQIRMVVTRSVRFLSFVALLHLAWPPSGVWAQTSQDNSGPASSTDRNAQDSWLEFRKTRYDNEPVLLHLRRGYERAVLMPEPIRLLDDSQTLPGCAIEIDTDVVGFFPVETFARQPIKLVGLQSGTVYELRVRASPEGIRQPLQITR